jgi:hypothetical protein
VGDWNLTRSRECEVDSIKSGAAFYTSSSVAIISSNGRRDQHCGAVRGPVPRKRLDHRPTAEGKGEQRNQPNCLIQ